MKYKCCLLFAIAMFAASCSSNGVADQNSVTPQKNSNTAVNDLSDPNSNIFAKNLPSDFAAPTDEVGRRLLKEYGAVFIARGGAVAPRTVVFKNDVEVSAFQSTAGSSRETIGGISIELQPAAMKALKDAVAQASEQGLTITPRGTDAAKRSYDDTVGLWKSRVYPGLDHWAKQGRVTDADANRIRSLTPYEQVSEIFKLEEQGIYFSKDLKKSIIYSVAPPGTSQHLSMLALDVAEFDNAEIRSMLAKHGWFQTVVSDLPHFTFLGVEESQLKDLGLKKVTSGDRVFWLPDL